MLKLRFVNEKTLNQYAPLFINVSEHHKNIRGEKICSRV